MDQLVEPSGPPRSCLVYTPSVLADAIVSVLGPSRNALWLEPSCGTGAFLKALARQGIKNKQVVGVDLRSRRVPADAAARVTRGIDFLEWAPLTTQRFDRIIGNPPYMRISTLPAGLRANATRTTFPWGEPVPVVANVWLAFVAASLSLLRTGGHVGLVLPASYEYSDYAQGLRREIGEHFQEVRVLRSDVPLFDRVAEGAVVLVAKGWHRGTTRVRVTRHTNRVAVIGELLGRRERRLTRATATSKPKIGNSTIRLRDVINLRIGAVTGNAPYFVLTEAHRRSRGIPVDACTRVLTRTNHLRAFINAEWWKRLRDADEGVWLFRPTPSVALKRAVKRYLDLRPARGGCSKRGYKVRNRTPWYRTPLPRPADVFLSGLSSRGPWLAINCDRRISATNTLYVGRFRDPTSCERAAAWGLALLTTDVFYQWEQRCRRYPDGLLKCEPGDLSELVLPVPPRCKGARDAYKNAIGQLCAGAPHMAREIADQWIKP
jgi:hypothetical protein